jgi:hypothetical protein
VGRPGPNARGKLAEGTTPLWAAASSVTTATCSNRCGNPIGKRGRPLSTLPRIAGAAETKDETVTLSRIIVNCTQSQCHYLADAADVDPHDFRKRVAQEVMDRLQSAGIDVVSR